MANINAVDKFTKAMEKANFKELQNLLNKGFDINIQFSDQKMPSYLIASILAKDVKMVRFFLENGANPNLIPYGNNTFFFTGAKVPEDIEILKLLIEYDTWLLPFWPMKFTLIEHLENIEYLVEQDLSDIEDDLLNTYFGRNNRNNNNRSQRSHGGGDMEDKINALKLELDIIREEITLLRPLKEKYVKQIKIQFFGQDRMELLEIDERADVKTLKTLLLNLFLDTENEELFDLILPSFRVKSKAKMDSSRTLADYGIRNETRIVVTPRFSSQRHGGGGRTKTRRVSRR